VNNYASAYQISLQSLTKKHRVTCKYH